MKRKPDQEIAYLEAEVARLREAVSRQSRSLDETTRLFAQVCKERDELLRGQDRANRVIRRLQKALKKTEQDVDLLVATLARLEGRTAAPEADQNGNL